MAGIREAAHKDLGSILRDKTYGFAWDITITSPAGTTKPLVGFSDDISQSIDPDTGAIISGRAASCALLMSDIYEQFPGEGLPENVVDSTQKPWRIDFNDIHDFACVFKCAKSNPDRASGLITLLLENYVP